MDAFYLAMTVLVAASPCALAIATPAAVLAGVARAARAGLLVKGGGPLETLGRVGSIAFDKTGTLTWGRPQVASVYAVGDEQDTLVRTVVAVEQLSDHEGSALLVVANALRLLRFQPGQEHAGIEHEDAPPRPRDATAKVA